MQVKNNYLYPSLVLSISIILAGYFISQTILNSKKFERYVTVKGLSEREVEADLAIWPIQITVVSDDLLRLQNDLQSQTEVLAKFFEDQKFGSSELTIGSPNIQDSRANLYGGQNAGNQYRYIATIDFTIRTSDIGKLHNAAGNIGSVIGKGIIVGSKNYYAQIEYLFTKLNDLKPEMIEESTKNARVAAENFAKDSQSKVGKIKSAYQGLFSISNRDVNTGYIKKVRVVSTFEFYLED